MLHWSNVDDGAVLDSGQRGVDCDCHAVSAHHSQCQQRDGWPDVSWSDLLRHHPHGERPLDGLFACNFIA